MRQKGASSTLRAGPGTAARAGVAPASAALAASVLSSGTKRSARWKDRPMARCLSGGSSTQSRRKVANLETRAGCLRGGGQREAH